MVFYFKGDEIMKKKFKFHFGALIVLTQFGSGILSFILSLKILQQNQSAFDFGMVVLISSSFSILTSLVSGKFIDKYNKKTMLLSAQVISLMGLTFFIFGTGFRPNLNIAWVIFLAIVLQVSDSVFTSTLISSAVQLVEDEDGLSEYNSLIESINGIAALVSPFIASAIFLILRTEYFVFIEMIFETMAIFLILTLPLQSRTSKLEDRNTEEVDYSIRSALNYAFKHKSILNLSISMLIVNLILGSFTIGLPYLIMTYFNNNTIFIGIFRLAMPVGMILGSIIYPKLNPKSSYFDFIINSWLILSMVTILMGVNIFSLSEYFSIFTSLSIILITIGGASIVIGKIPLLSHFQLTIPETEQGRIFSFIDVLVESTIPIGAGLYGFFFEKFSTSSVFIVSGIILVLYLLWLKKTLK